MPRKGGPKKLGFRHLPGPRSNPKSGAVPGGPRSTRGPTPDPHQSTTTTPKRPSFRTVAQKSGVRQQRFGAYRGANRVAIRKLPCDRAAPTGTQPTRRLAARGTRFAAPKTGHQSPPKPSKNLPSTKPVRFGTLLRAWSFIGRCGCTVQFPNPAPTKYQAQRTPATGSSKRRNGPRTLVEAVHALVLGPFHRHHLIKRAFPKGF